MTASNAVRPRGPAISVQSRASAVAVDSRGVTIDSPSHGAHGSHGSLKSYTVGFALSLLLTFASFGAVMLDVLPRQLRLPVIVMLCVAQLLVQLVYFLHMGSSPDQRSNTGIFICTALLIAIVVAGSLWVMHNANLNMMPMQLTPAEARAKE
ncbi:cytochrome bo3 quinol oxidase subunit 4 [Variovorax sp. OK605]|jgi:cytochrome o ubiquinol oxidase operon protein cyoD|nr:cytochrome o ubiquinol oxidase subunit IV [Variovorax sp. OK605]SFP60097.1 cytochrome bo3 quinol oxidase subunit 4 [Variovorax sp. OK605]